MKRNILFILALIIGVAIGLFMDRIPFREGMFSGEISKSSNDPEGAEADPLQYDKSTEGPDPISLDGSKNGFIHFSSDEARKWHRLGNTHIIEGRYGEAARCYENAVRAEPTSAEPLSSLGAALFSQQQYSDAVANWEKALEIDPTNIGALNGMAAIAFLEGRYHQAIEIYERIHIDRPRNLTSVLGLARCHEALGNSEKAIDYYRIFIENSRNRKDIEFANHRIQTIQNKRESDADED